MEIEKATLDDLDGIVDISKESFPEPETRNAYRNVILKSSYDIVVAKNDKVIGFAVLRPDGELAKIAVDSDHRGNGIGKKLLQKIIDVSFQTVKLKVRKSNTEAINFYKKNGFEVIEKRNRYYDNGDTAIVMRHSENPDLSKDWVDDLTDEEMAELNQSIDELYEEFEKGTRTKLLSNLKNEFSKNRVYADHPNDAPDWAEVQEGEQGGIYYETDKSEESKYGDIRMVKDIPIASPEYSTWIYRIDSDRDRLINNLRKEWQEYIGPQGGEGWQNTETGEVRYQEGKPDERRGGDEGDAGDTIEEDEVSLSDIDLDNVEENLKTRISQWTDENDTPIDVNRMVAFGSTVRGEAERGRSDLDIMLVTENPTGSELDPIFDISQRELADYLESHGNDILETDVLDGMDVVTESPNNAPIRLEDKLTDEEGDIYYEAIDIQTGEKITPDNIDKLFKERVYVDDPSEAPEDAELNEVEQEGAKHNYWYETEGGSDGDEVESDLPINLPELSDEPSYDDVIAAEQAWDEAKANLHNLKEEFGKETAVEIIRELSDRKDELRERYRENKDDEEEEVEGDTGLTGEEMREGTIVEDFGKEDAVNALSKVMHYYGRNRNFEENFEKWNILLDNMSQEELLEGAVKWTKTKIVKPNEKDFLAEDTKLLDWENEIPYEEYIEVTDGKPIPNLLNIAPVVSRMDSDTHEEYLEEVQGHEEEKSVLQSSVAFGKTPKAREKAFERLSDIDPDDRVLNETIFAFTEDYEEFKKEIGSSWTHARKGFDLLKAFGGSWAENQKIDNTIYIERTGIVYPISDIEMSSRTKEHLNKWRKEHEEKLNEIMRSPEPEDDEGDYSHEDWQKIQAAKNPDGTLTVHRGVNEEVTTHGTFESWTLDKEKAKEFDGYDVLSTDVRPDEIVASYFTAKMDGNQIGHNDEQEFILPGGIFK